MCHKCKSKIKSEGTYIANSEDFNTVIESHHDISFEPSDLFTERSRKYSGSMINAHEVIIINYTINSEGTAYFTQTIRHLFILC